MTTKTQDLFLMIGVLFVSFIAIDLVWEVLELLFEGEIQPSVPDTIIGILFAYTIWLYVKERQNSVQ